MAVLDNAQQAYVALTLPVNGDDKQLTLSLEISADGPRQMEVALSPVTRPVEVDLDGVITLRLGQQHCAEYSVLWEGEVSHSLSHLLKFTWKEAGELYLRFQLQAPNGGKIALCASIQDLSHPFLSRRQVIEEWGETVEDYDDH